MARFEKDVFPPLCTECGERAWRGAFCKRHYSKMAMRRWRTGTEVLSPRPTSLQRFEAKIDRTDNCWLWTAWCDSRGYGRFAITANKHMPAHRWAYEQWIGNIPDGMQIDHICRRTNCVNPLHLRAVTPKENSRYRSDQVTHCPQGHPYNLKNTLVSNNRRHCRTCSRQRSKEYQRQLYGRPDDVIENKAKTHCPRGHAYDDSNTYVHNGKRYCQICTTLAMRRFRGTPEDGPIAPPNALKTHCPAGHPYDETNTYFTKAGHRICRTCNRESAKRRRQQAIPLRPSGK